MASSVPKRIGNAQLISQLAQNTGTDPVQTRRMVNELCELLQYHLRHGTAVTLTGLGTLSMTGKRRQPIEFRSSEALRSAMPTADELKELQRLERP